VASFAALALYGVVRWATLIRPAPSSRLLGLLVLALAVAAGGGPLARRSRPLALAAGIIAVLALFPICGVPLTWVRHVRIAVTANGVGEGLSSLPGVLLPYSGINQWIQTVILLGAGVLLLDAALLLAFAAPVLGDLRRAGAALPLIALAVVPSTLLRPRLPYLQGLLLFGLIAAFMWGDRVKRADLSVVLGVCALAGAGAMIAAPGLEQHKPWINYQALAGGLAPGKVASFDWSQTYGPIHWPRTGREVLDVRASQADYWKAENIDVFDGRGWVAAPISQAGPLTGVNPSTAQRWTQTLQVTIRAMKTTSIIAAGAANKPTRISSSVSQAASPGTWAASAALGPGDSYRVQVYTPQPTGDQLAHVGDAYPSAALAAYRFIEVPQQGKARVPIAILFPPFHSGLPVYTGLNLRSGDGAAVMRASPYARAYALARRLASESATPYAYVSSVEAYLARGFTYEEAPPPRTYPLESFLFQDKVGYCQQFAGAMALLLRMGGVPARVAAGFTTGTYDRSNRQWVVSDIDAHAWVEAWFPRYGWVRFDPTPAADPALGGRTPISSAGALGAGALPRPLVTKRETASPTAATTSTKRGSGSTTALPIVLLAAALVAGALALLLTRARPEPDGEALLAELERAMTRTGRPIPPEVTLAELEQRVLGHTEAAEYIQALRLARFGGRSSLPTLRQRAALRTQLRAGLGLAGTVRALWALPPRWTPPARASHTRTRRIKSK